MEDSKIFQTDFTGREKDLAINLNQEGEELFTQGDTEGALKRFHSAIQACPNFSFPHNNLGVVYWQKGEIPRALGHFAKALEMNPNDRQTTLNCGEVFRSLGKIEDTLEIYASYLKRNPGDGIVLSAFEKLQNTS